MTRHRRKRDVPSTEPVRGRKFVSGGEGRRFGPGRDREEHRTVARIEKRIQKEDGSSFQTRSLAAGTPPARPPFCMLFEDLAPARAQPATVFGMYPPQLIPKVLPWLECERREILHVCSGGLPPGEGIRVDIRPEARPDIVADGRHLPFADGSIAGVMLDPPYSEHYAKELYGTSYPRPAHLLAEAARVVRRGGRIVFVHYIVPNPPDGCTFIRAFGLSMGFGYPMRAVSIFERHQAELAFPTPTEVS